MLLSDGEILDALAAGEISIDPPPSPGSNQIQAASVDLRLGSVLFVHPSAPVSGVSIDPAAVNVQDQVHRQCERVDISNNPYEIQPMGFVLGQTMERVEIPLTMAGRVEGKSSLARFGMTVHITAPKIDPGYRGTITLEMFNLGPFPLRLSYGMDICSLMFDRLGRPADIGYAGQFQG